MDVQEKALSDAGPSGQFQTPVTKNYTANDPRYSWIGLKPVAGNIAGGLKALDQWVCWRADPKYNPDGNLTRVEKIPISPYGGPASVTAPNTWGSFSDAWGAYEESGGTLVGVGFVLTEQDGFIALDFDHVRNPQAGEIDEPVLRAIERLDTYAEISPSGTGIRIIGKGKVPPGNNSSKVLQLWGHARYVTMTGHSLNGAGVTEFDPDLFLKVRNHFIKQPSLRPEGSGLDIAEAVSDVITGDGLHDPMRSLAASLATVGASQRQIEGTLQGILSNSAARNSDPGRWKARREEIPRLASSAVEKYGPSSTQDAGDWADPQPLPAGLAPVEPFPYKVLPASLQPWVQDICERVQCPPDYVGVAAITALASVLGRKVGIRPQERTEWTEFGNVWALIIGRPGVLKSPAMEAALKPNTRE